MWVCISSASGSAGPGATLSTKLWVQVNPARQVTVRCRKCNAIIGRGATYCFACGRKVRR